MTVILKNIYQDISLKIGQESAIGAVPVERTSGNVFKVFTGSELKSSPPGLIDPQFESFSEVPWIQTEVCVSAGETLQRSRTRTEDSRGSAASPTWATPAS